MAHRATVISGNSQTEEPRKTSLGNKQLLMTEALLSGSFLYFICCFMCRSWTCPLKGKDSDCQKWRNDELLTSETPRLWKSRKKTRSGPFPPPPHPPPTLTLFWPAHPSLKQHSFPQTSLALQQASQLRGFSWSLQRSGWFCSHGLS